MMKLGAMIKNVLRDYQEVARKGVRYGSLMEEVKKKNRRYGTKWI